MKKIFFDNSTINVAVLSLLSFLESLQVLIVVALVYSFIPIPVPVFVQKLFPLSLYDVRLERESSFYHLWIAAALGLQGLLVFLNRKNILQENTWRKHLPYVSTMAVLMYLQVFAVFKIFLWGNPWWARDVFYLLLAVGILIRIFWPEFWRWAQRFWSYLNEKNLSGLASVFTNTGAVFLVMALVFWPDLSQTLARMFSYDKFYHLDSFIMSPAWAHHQGLVLNRDVNSEYSLIIPLVFDRLMGLLGGINYENALVSMIALCAAYYLLLFGLWRFWIGSFSLSFMALVLCIKLQFFHWGVIPLIWIYPSATPLRTLFDVFFLFFILRYSQEVKSQWLFAAAILSGVGLAWTLDVGVYMYFALIMAAASFVFLNGTSAIRKVFLVLLVPWIIAGGILSLCYGTLIKESYFWHNTFEFASLFVQGWGALPMTEGLKDKQFFGFCMGFVIPIIYLGTFLYSLGMFLFVDPRLKYSGMTHSGKEFGDCPSGHLFISIVSFYGLGLYHYFIHRSGVNSYYAVIVPFIFVLLFWAKTGISIVPEKWQKGVRLFLSCWALAGLITSYWYTFYPNWLNLSAWDWSKEKRFFAEQFDFYKDAALVDSLTSGQEPVALISSFETKILMQANRRPFFYYFPMMESEHMQGDNLRGIYIHTYARLVRTLKQLQDQRPAHIFIQTRLINGPEAENYENAHEGFKELMAYIRKHYQYQAQGQYLTALQLET